MITTKELTINSTDRVGIRKQLINEFLEENPGTGKGALCSVYFYYVETLQNGNRIYLKRPARLNKGFDFEVNVENSNFGIKRRTTMPSHTSIHNDLFAKKSEDPAEFKKLHLIIERIYNCEDVDDIELTELDFKTGHPAELILKSIKWLFIEQDITYWNWSGRDMLHSGLSKLWK